MGAIGGRRRHSVHRPIAACDRTVAAREPERLNAAFDQNALIIFAEIDIAFAVAAGHHPVSARFGQKQTWDAA